MNKLKNRDFKNYLESLEVTNACGYVYAQNEYGIICEINTTNEQVTQILNVAVIDREEYKLSDKQQDAIILYTEGFIHNKGAEGFTPEDYTHFLNLIYA